MTKDPIDRLNREQWMLAQTMAGAIRACNAPFCADVGNSSAVDRDPNYINYIAEALAELCGPMMIDSTMQVLTQSLRYLESQKYKSEQPNIFNVSKPATQKASMGQVVNSDGKVLGDVEANTANVSKSRAKDYERILEQAENPRNAGVTLDGLALKIRVLAAIVNDLYTQAGEELPVRFYKLMQEDFDAEVR